MYLWAMKINIFLLFSIWIRFSTEHMTLESSFSPMSNTEKQFRGEKDYHASNGKYFPGLNSSTTQISIEPLSSGPAPASALKSVMVDTIDTSPALKVLSQHCEYTNTRLVCNDKTTFQDVDVEECIPLNFENVTFEGGISNLHNLTEAVFDGVKAFTCIGSPLLLNGFLPQLKSLHISHASNKALSIIAQAAKINGQLDQVTSLNLTSNEIFDQDLLNESIPNEAIEQQIDKSAYFLPNLKTLDLSNNSFVRLNLSPYFQVAHMIVNGCPNLKSITVEYITSRHRIWALETLSCSGNPELVSISPWIIPSSPKLLSLDLSSNPRLLVFPTSFFSSSLLDRVNLNNSSFVCDCNLKNHDSDLFGHLKDKNCSDPKSLQTFQTQDQYSISSCSNNQSAQGSTDIKQNVTGVVDSDVVMNCPSSLSGHFSTSNGDNHRITTNIAWITPSNEILVWIRQFTQWSTSGQFPRGEDEKYQIVSSDEENIFGYNFTSHVSDVKGLANSTTNTTAHSNVEEINSSVQPWEGVLRSECVPSEEYTVLSRSVYFGADFEGRIMVIPQNGSLLIQNLGWSDRGRYRCYAWNNVQETLKAINKTGIDDGPPNTQNTEQRAGHLPGYPSQLTSQSEIGNSIRLLIETEYRQRLYQLSLVYGFATAGGFLLITLFAKLVSFLLHNYGCCLFCCCCKDQLPPKAKRLKKALDSIEGYRTQQLVKLRENYHQQSDWIRQNCAVQMEKVRDNYNYQTENLKGIRQFGSTQLQGVRDQYYDQMQRIRDYSNSQLERVNENYIFQRQKLRKFSAQNYLKMRETKKYTQKTLNKVMENLPALYLDLTACRQGLRDRQPSLEWEQDEFQEMELGPPITSATLQMSKESNKKAFIYNTRENSAIQLDRKGISLNQGGAFGGSQATGERGSDSVYFTPSGTPLRELSTPPSKGGKNVYSAVYQQHDDMETGNSNTLPNNCSKTGSNFSARLTKAPFIKSHGKSKSFSFPFMPSYWFGSNNPASNTFSNVNGDTSCEYRDGEVHRVLVEREACGSNDYLSTGELVDTLKNPINSGECQGNLNYETQNAGLDTFGRDYDECDGLLPQSEQMALGPKENCNNKDVSLISSSVTTSSSNTNESPSSIMGISTDTTTNNSESFTNTTKPNVDSNISNHSGKLSSSSSLAANFPAQCGVYRGKSMNNCASKNTCNSCTTMQNDGIQKDLVNQRFTRKRQSF